MNNERLQRAILECNACTMGSQLSTTNARRYGKRAARSHSESKKANYANEKIIEMRVQWYTIVNWCRQRKSNQKAPLSCAASKEPAARNQKNTRLS